MSQDEKKQEAGQNLGEFMRGAQGRQQNIQTAGARTREDLGTGEQMFRRDLGTQEAYDVQSQSLASVLQRQKQREFERAQTIGAPPGVNPLSYNIDTFQFLQ